MRSIPALVAAVATVAAVGCNSISGCNEDRQRIEDNTIARLDVTAMEARGYDCRFDGKTSSPGPYGVADHYWYVCTKCL